MIDATQAGTAFILGLSGAGHCLGMCGGIAAALNLGGARSSAITVAYHTGRITSYTLLGALLGLAAASIDIRCMDHRPALSGWAAADWHGTVHCQLVARHGTAGASRRQTVATGATPLFDIATAAPLATGLRARPVLGPDALRPDLQQPGVGGHVRRMQPQPR